MSYSSNLLSNFLGGLARRWSIGLGYCLLSVLAAQISFAQTEEAALPSSAEAQIDTLHTTLMGVARSNLGFDERVELLQQEFDRVFDLQRIARISAGSSWRGLDDDRRTEYVSLLQQVLLGTYVTRFDADRGQKLEVLETLEIKPGRTVVRARITRPSGATVSLDYYLRNGKVFNVEADGVSDLSLRRADYSRIVAADGIEGLLANLRKKIESYRSSFRSAHQ